jgi:hypothetical protein
MAACRCIPTGGQPIRPCSTWSATVCNLPTCSTPLELWKLWPRHIIAILLAGVLHPFAPGFIDGSHVITLTGVRTKRYHQHGLHFPTTHRQKTLWDEVTLTPTFRAWRW